MKRPARSRRHIGRREPHIIIRVLTEGAVTECEYLRRIRGPAVRLDSSDAGMAPMTLVERARAYQRAERRVRAVNRRFDEIWCVFGRDEHPDFERAVREARDAGIRTAISNPCFELWLVLHLEEQTAHIERHAIQRRARALGLIEDKRLGAAADAALNDGYDTAAQRARNLDDMHERDGSPPGSNPSSGVWRLADRLRRP